MRICHVYPFGFSPGLASWVHFESCFFPIKFLFTEREVCIPSSYPSGRPLYPAMVWFCQVHNADRRVGGRSRGRGSSCLDFCTYVHVVSQGPPPVLARHAHHYTVPHSCGSSQVVHIIAPGGYGVMMMTCLDTFRT